MVERTLARFSQFRRLSIRYERRADIHKAFLTLAAALICFRFVQHAFCQELLESVWKVHHRRLF